MAQRKKTSPKLEEVSSTVLLKLKDLRKGVGLRKFNSATDRSYIQWKNEAENLIIRVFGESSNQYKQFHSIDYKFRMNQPKEPAPNSNAAYYKMLKLGYTEAQIEEMTDAQWAKLISQKGVLKEVEKEQEEREEEYQATVQAYVNDLKIQMRDAFTAWINEIELFVPVEAIAKMQPKSGISIKNVQSQNVNVTVNVEQTINNILEDIRSNEPDEERIKEAEQKLGELKEEIKKEKPQWSIIKNILVWALNFSKEVFLRLLPILLEKYSQ